MVFLAPAGAPEAGQRAVSIADIAHLPMIGTRNAGCRQIIDDAFRQAPTSPTYVFRSDDHPTIQGLIGSGLAYAVLPLLTVDENDPNVAVIPIRPEPPPRRLGIAWHPERRPPRALLPFVEAAAEICRDLGDQWAASRPREHPWPCDAFAAETNRFVDRVPGADHSTPVPTCPQGTSATSCATSAATTGRRERRATSRAHGSGSRNALPAVTTEVPRCPLTLDRRVVTPH